MKNTIKLDHENRRIVMDKTFAKLSEDVRNEEYDILQRVRKDYSTHHCTIFQRGAACARSSPTSLL